MWAASGGSAARVRPLVAAAPALWSEAARLYGIFANDLSRAVVDEALMEILSPCASRHELAVELSP